MFVTLSESKNSGPSGERSSFSRLSTRQCLVDSRSFILRVRFAKSVVRQSEIYREIRKHKLAFIVEPYLTKAYYSNDSFETSGVNESERLGEIMLTGNDMVG